MLAGVPVFPTGPRLLCDKHGSRIESFALPPQMLVHQHAAQLGEPVGRVSYAARRMEDHERGPVSGPLSYIAHTVS
jgi:hypothetical protein